MPIMPLILHKRLIFFRVEPPTNIVHWCFYGVGVLLHDSDVPEISTNGAQALGFALCQPFEVYTWQAYVPPGVGLWPMPWAH